MGITVTVQPAIVIGAEFVVEFSIDDPLQPGTFEIILSTEGEEREFGMKRKQTVLPVAPTQVIPVAGIREWTVFDAALPADAQIVTVTVREVAPGARSGFGEGAIV
jgi:hypothetical protein